MTKKKFLTGGLILTAAFMLAGCGSKSKANEGYYPLTEITEGDVTVSEKDLDEYGLEDSYAVFYDDGDGYLVLMDTPSDFTYDKKKEVLNTDFGEVSISVKGKTVTLSDSQVSMTFTKSKESTPEKPDYPSFDGAAWATDGGDDWSGGSSGGSGGEAVVSDAALDFWNDYWFGWMEIDGFMNEYDQYEGIKYPMLAYTTLEADGTGTMLLWDNGGHWAEIDCSNNGHGLTDLGTMVSESGYFYDYDLGHADWNIDPGTDPKKRENYVYIDGRCEDENGEHLFTYDIHLVKWGQTWDGFDDDELPDEYYWYLQQFEDVVYVPDQLPE